MIIHAEKYAPVSTSEYTMAINCPGCGHQAIFEAIGINDTAIEQYAVGLRRCPHLSCRTLVYHIRNRASDEILATFPSVRIDFDRSNIPDKILATLEEAITCHSNSCFVAAAIMVRKTLDLLCTDRGGTGNNLKDRIASLVNKVLIPKELLDGMDDLRLLGNDAAHVESNVFDQIGKVEIEIAIEFTKEILKAVFQYSSLLAKLKSLKRATP